MPPEKERYETEELEDQLQLKMSPGPGESDLQLKAKITWEGFKLLWAVLGAIIALSLAIVLFWTLGAPRASDFGSPITADSLALYQKASESFSQHLTSLFEQVVVKVLLPVLTLLLGYVFGSRAGQSES
ncbi:MAG: hypothetical protein Q8O86_00915 [Dehalococcoidia bacterium]|nr:hypothetical protein [Dehalococcoidia bacterium]